MFNISTLNKISPYGIQLFGNQYSTDETPENADAIIVRSADMHEMNFSNRLAAVARAGAGVNNIPIEKCTESGVVVFNTPGANANAVKELVIAGMLLCSRDIIAGSNWAHTLNSDIKTTVEANKSTFAGSEIKGKTLGIIGLGSIGVMVANAALDLEMNVIGYDRNISLKSALGLSRKIVMTDTFDEILANADFISVHVPFVAGTKNFFSGKQFKKMKHGVSILNFARDGIIDESSIGKYLDSGRIHKYVTDFPNENLQGQNGVILIPHLGASTSESEDNCAIMACKQIKDYLENGNIANSVNFPDCSLGNRSSQRVIVLHKNIPTMLGQITGAISSRNLNIGDLINRSKGDFACTLINLDNTSSDGLLLNEISSISGVLAVRILN